MFTSFSPTPVYYSIKGGVEHHHVTASTSSFRSARFYFAHFFESILASRAEINRKTYIENMAPTDLDLAQTKRWLAQLHTTDLPSAAAAPPPILLTTSCSSLSSAHSGNSMVNWGDGSSNTSPTSSLGGGIDTRHTSVSSTTSNSSSGSMETPSPSPLTETRARRLQRLCDIGDANNCTTTASPHHDVNAGMSPNNINYMKNSTVAGWAASRGDVPWSPNADAPPVNRQRRWSRKQSWQSLEDVEGQSMRGFSLSRLISRW